MANIVSAPSSPSTNAVTPDVITGAGYLQWVGAVTPLFEWHQCLPGLDHQHHGDGGGERHHERHLHNCQGGQDGYYYDVFATGALASPITNAVWAWMGQGYHCNTYTIPS